jgi:CBS-domain-containing membrane protein
LLRGEVGSEAALRENIQSCEQDGESKMKAADVMTQHVISIKPDSSIMEAAQLMLLNRISGLPVLDDRGKLVGIITEGDLLRRAETGTEHRRPRWIEFFMGPGSLASEYVHTHGRKISEV